MIFPDRCEIVAITLDAKTGSETRGTAVSVRCLYDETKKLSYSANGTPFRREGMFFLPFDTSVKEGDEIRATMLNGSELARSLSKVKSSIITRGMRHVEVEI